MLTIYKYPISIADAFDLSLPEGAMVLRVECQAGQPCLWALVDTERRPEVRRFLVAGTGFDLDPRVFHSSSHVATFQQGLFVWHLFEDPS